VFQQGITEPGNAWAPLAERMRPTSLADFVGQRHLLGEGKLLPSLLADGRLTSILLWGPPGSGKTTLARLLADEVDAHFVPLSAVTSGVKDLRASMEGARLRGLHEKRQTVLFVDEIHRFNKAQQDAMLPYVESGAVTLIGATTENPGFEVNGALRSRCRVLALHALGDDELGELAHRALTDEGRGLGPTAPDLSAEAMEQLLHAAQGDGRSLLNTLEIAASIAARSASSGTRGEIMPEHVASAAQKKGLRYDKGGDNHYKLTSAFIKSMRGSDPDAALYYMIRMLEAGEDPGFVLRRMVIFASEDIGNADPRALQVAVSAQQAFAFVGMPEGVLPLTQACTYLATAPKSNAVFAAYGRARKDVLAHPSLDVPNHLVQANDAVSKQMGYGRGYRYPHNYDGNYVAARYLPSRLEGRRYYEPSENGYEVRIAERLDTWRREAADGEDGD
jgi:putative ATPase